MPVPRESAAQRSNQVKHSQNAEAVAAAVAVTRNSREHGANHGSDERDRNGESQPFSREIVYLGQRLRSTGYHRSVKAEQESPEGRYYSTFQKVGVDLHSYLGLDAVAGSAASATPTYLSAPP